VTQIAFRGFEPIADGYCKYYASHLVGNFRGLSAIHRKDGTFKKDDLQGVTDIRH